MLYSEKDFEEINGKLRKNLIVLLPILAAILAAFIYGLSAGIEWLAMAAGPLLFVAACYGFLAYLLPNLRYRGFLRDLNDGLSRDMEGTLVEIAEQPEYQDGARVLQGRIFLDEAQDERFVYLNYTKREGFPKPGAHVILHCFGRHIRGFEAA